MEDKFHDECGVFAIVDHDEAPNHAYLGLLAQQHRGQESAGIVSSDGRKLHSCRGMGKVFDVFDQDKLASLPGRTAIGHVRYSTAGRSTLSNAQPLVMENWRGEVALAHNGNLIQTHQLKSSLERDGAVFRSDSDSEVIQHLLARNARQDLVEALIEVLASVRGAYSLLVATADSVFAIRDPLGFRPLCLGRLGEAWTVASETSAFDLIGAEYVRDVEPGEVLRIRGRERTSSRLAPPGRRAHCIFEHVYFSRPDSRVFGRSVHRSRFAMGQVLAREAPAPADMIVPVPDSGVTAALGFADAAGLPLQMGLVRNHYVGRTFIEPKQSIRNFGVKVKLNPVKEILEGKSVVLIDDSIVRGTTSRKIVELVRAAGAREVHLRISSPPTVSPCLYGINTPTREELIASKKSLDEIQDYVGADSLAYLSLDGLKRAVGDENDFCCACFDEDYPVPELPQSKQPVLFDLQDSERLTEDE